MKSIPMTELFLHILVLVDDWYQDPAMDCRRRRPGKKPAFSDSEVMTIMLAMDFVAFASERQSLAYVCANYSALFPRLLEQSQCNRRARAAAPLLEAFRQHWLVRLGVTLVKEGLLDTKPVPVPGYRRNKTGSDFLGRATDGYCASKKMYYLGYKLVTIST